MKVTLLGTGGADGWPTAFCTCASCAAAAEQPRAQTCVLVDDALALDFGPLAPFQAVRAGVSLAHLRAVAVTHGHDDHLDPANLLYRGWVTDAPLTFAGPAPVLEQVEPWLAPGQRAVELRALEAGCAADLHGYQVVPCAARHMHWSTALLYGVSDGERRLLYATDSAPLPDSGWEPLRALGGPLDLLLLEETFGDRDFGPDDHHGLRTFEDTLAQLRRLGYVTSSTQVVAVHLAHHNPPPAELDARLAEIGRRLGLPVRAGRDGERIEL